MIQLAVALVVLVFASIVNAQDNSRPRVYIEQSDSWEVESDSPVVSTTKKGGTVVSGGSSKGGAKPRTAEIMKRFDEQCKETIVTINKDKADFIVMLEHEGGKSVFNKDNKLAIFNKDGDLISSGSFSRTQKAVDIACNAIMQEYRSQKRGERKTE
jgi:hypothetical protein